MSGNFRTSHVHGPTVNWPRPARSPSEQSCDFCEEAEARTLQSGSTLRLALIEQGIIDISDLPRPRVICDSPNNPLRHFRCQVPGCDIRWNNRTTRRSVIATQAGLPTICLGHGALVRVLHCANLAHSKSTQLTLSNQAWQLHIPNIPYVRPDDFSCSQCGQQQRDRSCTSCLVRTVGNTPITPVLEKLLKSEKFGPKLKLRLEDTCVSCILREMKGSGKVEPWDWRPDFTFFPENPAQTDNGLYIGIEFETAFESASSYSSRDRISSWVNYANDEIGARFFYAKNDSTVHNGAEINTMPFNPAWSWENIPWELMDDLLGLAALERHQSAGGHIHMARGSFTPLTWHKFQLFHFINRRFIGVMGERGTDARWGSLDEITHTQMPAQNLHTIFQRSITWQGGSRSGINMRNDNTIELRYPAGWTSQKGALVRTQWVDSIFEFCRATPISATDVRTLAFDNYWTYVKQHSDRYPDLHEVIRRKNLVAYSKLGTNSAEMYSQTLGSHESFTGFFDDLSKG